MKFSRCATTHLLLRWIRWIFFFLSFFLPLFPPFFPSFLSAREAASLSARASNHEKKSFSSESLSWAHPKRDSTSPSKCSRVHCTLFSWYLNLSTVCNCGERRPTFPVIISRGRRFAFLFSCYRGAVNIRLLLTFIYISEDGTTIREGGGDRG